MSESEPWQWKSIPVAPKAASGPSVLRIVLELAIPLAVSALLFAFEKKIMAGVILAIGLSLFTANRVSAKARAALERFFAKVAYWVGEILTLTLLTPVYYGILTPVAFVLRLRGEDPLDTAIDPDRPSYWVDASFRREKKRYFNQFTYERYADPTGGASNPIFGLITALLWFLLLNTAAGFGLGLLGVGDGKPLDHRAASEVYAKVDESGATTAPDWVEPYYEELAETPMDFRPYLGWSRKDTPEDFEHIEVRDGVRVSTDTPPAPVADVAFFGGSTMWGVGSPDEGTIPSAFQRISSAAGLPVRATNHGEDAYVQWQEILRLTEMLAAGEVPDVVVVYDGGNDVFAHYQTPQLATEGLVQQNQRQYESKVQAKPSVLKGLLSTSGLTRIYRALRSLGAAEIPPPYEREWPVAEENEARIPSRTETATILAERYLEGLRHLERLSEAYGFSLVVAWQPTVFTRPDVDLEEDAELPEDAREEMKHANAYGPDLIALYREVRERLGPAFDAHGSFHDLGQMLADEEGPVYIDWIHVGPESNEKLARRLFELARPAIEARQGR